MQKFLLSISFIVFYALSGFGQCTPDAAGCPDLGNPGEICPAVLPQGTQNVSYNQTITVLSPDSAEVLGVTLALNQIELVSIENIPPGLSYASNEPSLLFLAGNYYCIQLSGTPTVPGNYPLRITVKPYILVFGIPVPSTNQVDSTSVSIEILPGTSSMTDLSTEFSWSANSGFMPNLPEGFNCPSPSKVKMNVFNSMGQLVINQNIETQAGLNFLPHNLNELNPGVYFISLVSGNEKLVHQWFKSE
jgi:hypothetical protein